MNVCSLVNVLFCGVTLSAVSVLLWFECEIFVLWIIFIRYNTGAECGPDSYIRS